MLQAELYTAEIELSGDTGVLCLVNMLSSGTLFCKAELQTS
jgi:hypothetical protein